LRGWLSQKNSASFTSGGRAFAVGIKLELNALMGSVVIGKGL
jgi:hypothetical protein